MAWTPLILDTFQFDEAHLETPESFGDMGGSQSIAQHDYPGGTRTQKAFGYFPSALKWRAKFHGSAGMGPTFGSLNPLGNQGLALAAPEERIAAVTRIVVAGKEVKLQFGTRSWLGLAARFAPVARHAWLYEYELEFWPRLDFSAPGPTVPPVTDIGTVLALHLLALKSLIQYGLDPAFVGQAAAAAIGGPAGFLISQVQDIMAASGGVVANVTPAQHEAIHSAATTASAACLPYQQGTNPVLSSPAADANARIMAIHTLMDNAGGHGQPVVLATVQVINPSLPVLAAQYYNDASQWRRIALANPSVNGDPQPTGSFNLIIPRQEP